MKFHKKFLRILFKFLKFDYNSYNLIKFDLVLII